MASSSILELDLVSDDGPPQSPFSSLPLLESQQRRLHLQSLKCASSPSHFQTVPTNSFLGRLLLLPFRILVSTFGPLLLVIMHYSPGLFAWIDRVCSSFEGYIGAATLWIRRLFKGDTTQPSQSDSKGHIESSAQRQKSADTAYFTPILQSRFGSVARRISRHVDEDAAAVLRLVANSYEVLVDTMLPLAYTFIDTRSQEKPETRVVGEKQKDGAAQIANGMNEGDDRNDAQNASRDSTFNNTTVAQDSEKGHMGNRNSDLSHSGRTLPAIRIPVYRGGVIDRSVTTTLPRLRIRSEGLSSPSSPTRGSSSQNNILSSTTLQIVAPSLGTPESPVSSPDDMPTHRHRSHTAIEAARLTTISSTAASRLRHHWLRPCAACARRKAEEKRQWREYLPAMIDEPDAVIDDEVEGSEQRDGALEKMVDWIKRH